MAAFDLALCRVRAGADDLLPAARIDQLARAGDVQFRNTTLTPGRTLRLFAQQVAHGNIACSAVHHLAGEDFTDSAWCQDFYNGKQVDSAKNFTNYVRPGRKF